MRFVQIMSSIMIKDGKERSNQTLTYNYKNMKLYNTVTNDWKKWFAWYPVELQT